MTNSSHDISEQAIAMVAVNRRAVLACLSCLGIASVHPETDPDQSPETLDERALSLDQLIEFAAEYGFQVQAVRLNWQDLQAGSEAAVFLVLRNANVVAITENERNAGEAIFLCDPQYRGGIVFPISRTELETLWGGDALLVRPLASGTEPESTIGPTSEKKAVIDSPNTQGPDDLDFSSASGFEHIKAARRYAARSGGPSSAEETARGSEAASRLATHDKGYSLGLTSLGLAIFGVVAIAGFSGGLLRYIEPPSTELDPVLTRIEALSSPGLDVTAAILPIERVVAVQIPESEPAPQKRSNSARVSAVSQTAAIGSIASEAPEVVASAVISDVTPPASGRNSGTPLAKAASTVPDEPQPNLLPQRNPSGASGSASDQEPVVVPTTAEVPPVSEMAAVPATKTAPQDDAIAANVPQTADITIRSPPSPPTQPALAAFPAEEVVALLTRGDTLFSQGDIASARLFYQRASERGVAEAALRLAQTYDPEFLAWIGRNTVLGDATASLHWYRRASELGIKVADILLSGTAEKNNSQPSVQDADQATRD